MNISRLPIPDSQALPEELQTLFATAKDKLGFVPNVLHIYSLRPDHLLAWRNHYELLMRGESKLTLAQREMIAVTVSSLNRCFYCSTTHPAFLRLELAKEGKDPNIASELQFAPLDADISDAEKAMLEFAIKITLESHNILPSDLEKLRQHGFADEAIFDIAEVAAMFNLTNRLINALGGKPNPEYHQLGR
ncbi:MAG: peroxidase-related enzyme [Deinococcales bacterium]